MIFNMMMVGGGGSGGQIYHGTFSKDSGTGTYSFTGLAGQPKVFVLASVTNSSTNGNISYAVLVNGAYVGKAASGRSTNTVRYKDSEATWDGTTFTISGWNNYGDYEYYYTI